MAVTATLVNVTGNRLRYLITHDGAGGDSLTIPNTNGATPDLGTDIATAQQHVSAPPLKSIIDAGRNGLAQVAAGALTQAQARGFMNSDNTGAVLTNDNVPRAECQIVARAGQSIWEVDVNVDGGANPVVSVTGTAATVATAYLDIVRTGGVGL